MTAPETDANFLWAGALLDQLCQSGVSHLCLCPGSRSAPLAVAAAQVPGLRVFTHVDERAAAFFGLGIARATRAPVALVCTSGTAAANFAPAMAEAAFARIPLLALTADRPPELRGFGAGQTIVQTGLYGSHPRWSFEAPLPDATPAGLDHVRSLAARAVAEACGSPPGPVHLNLPFRDPLHPTPGAGPFAPSAPAGPAVHSRRGVAQLSPDDVRQLATRLQRHGHGALVCGPLDADPTLAEGLVRLALKLGWPLIADVLSGLRNGDAVKDAPLVTSHDALLRDPTLCAALAPDCVVRFGDTPTSKATRQWLAGAGSNHTILVDPDGAWQDPDFACSEIVRADPASLVHALDGAIEDPAAGRPNPWLARWMELESAAQHAMASEIEEEAALFEPRALRHVADLIPEGGGLFVSSSMPVRDADGFLPVTAKRIRTLANRGANGIDGVTSSALGLAAVHGRSSVLVTGDLALLHDLGGLLAAHQHRLRLTIVVFQNDGGGIFSYLPIAEHGEAVHFEAHFRVPHGLQVREIARLFGLGYERACDAAGFREALAAAVSAHRTTLVEVPIDADQSVAHHRRLWAAAADAAREALG